MKIQVAAQIDVEIDDDMLAQWWADSDIEAEQRADAEKCAFASLQDTLHEAHPVGVKYELLYAGTRIMAPVQEDEFDHQPEDQV